MTMIELQQVSKTYGRSKVINDVSLVAQQAQTTVLIGASGCGKSTLLRLMLGLIRPDPGGQVLLNGQNLTAASDAEVRRLRLEVGYVIQDGGLFPHLTARENITLMAKELRMPADGLAKRIEELLELTKFPPDGLNRYPVELSGGQRQRVAIMRALVLEPTVLLLDEPLGALDPMIRFDLQQDLRTIFDQLNATVVMVTHDLVEAAFFGHTIVLLNQGRILQQGTLQDMIDNPADEFVLQFVNAQRGHTLETTRT